MARGGTSKAARERRQKQPYRATPDDVQRSVAGDAKTISSGPAVGYTYDQGIPRPEIEGVDVKPFRVPNAQESDPKKRTAIFVPTIALKTLIERGRREDLELQLDPEVEDRIDPNGQHQLLDPHRVTAPNVDFVRVFARILLKAKEGEALPAYEVFLDLPTRYVGMLVEASRPRETSRVRKAPLPGTPRWAGAWSFPHAYDAALKLGRGERPPGPPHPREAVALGALRSLREAHVVVIDPEQVAVLPEWEGWENLWDYAADVELPFDPIYLDLEGPGGVAPVIHGAITLEDDKGEVSIPATATIRGALLHCLPWTPQTEELTGRLVIDPIGELWFEGEEQTGPSYEIMGRVVLNADEPEGGPVGVTPLRIINDDDQDIGGGPINTASVKTSSITNSVNTPGFVVVPVTLDETRAVYAGDQHVQALGRMILLSAAKILAALSITESEAVVIDETILEPRDRKRAEKRGWPIADRVFIRPTRKGGESNVTGEEAHYSHRFWVRGHTKHFPLGTRLADTRPDLVKPCSRVGDASCGFCRRVWTPPFIKGPEDKPLVLKSLVKRRSADAVA